ncbi:MAG: branched-chain amino acid ABC transporter permease [Flavobacteriaceae bacterium]
MNELANIIAVGLLLGGTYALVSVGLNLIFGVIRIVNFAQGEFLMLGMYGTYVVYAVLGVDPYLAAFVVVPALFVFGAAVYWFLLRPLQGMPMMQVFATFGLLIVLENIVLALTGGTALSVNSVLTGHSLTIAGVTLSLSRLLVFVVATAVALGLGLYLRLSIHGKAIRAVAQDRRAAQLMGIRIGRIYTVTFGFGAALAGLAGCLLAPLYSMSPQIGTSFILPAFAVVVLGGLGSVKGAFIGGLIVGLTEATAGFYLDPALKHAVLFMVFIAVLIVRPSGLFGVVGAEEVGLHAEH